MPEKVTSSGSGSPIRRKPRGRHSGIRLGSIGGFEISLDYSWFIILVLIVASFTTAVFPPAAPGLGQGVYIFMGLVGALLFFASLLLHELAHSFVARAKGIEVQGITLFIFGGMARTAREASTPGDEFLIAAVGPLASFALAVLFYAAASTAPTIGLGLEFVVVAEYLGILNLILAVFNLLPGFPLDGGRLFRATLWRFTGSFRKATRIASGVGRALGWGLIALGVYSFFFAGGGFIGGLWLVFIGWFLGNAARMSYEQVLLQEMLSPLTAGEAMSPNPETVAPDLPIDTLVHDHFLRMPYSAFPVTDDGVVIGIVTLGQVRALSRDDWKEKRVSDIMVPLEETVLLPPETPMTVVLERMRDAGTRRILVAREWELVGIISSTDIARWLDRAALMD
ncbi:MAG: site-2 protease family protein [Gemmatimonadota bacterium]